MNGEYKVNKKKSGEFFLEEFIKKCPQIFIQEHKEMLAWTKVQNLHHLEIHDRSLRIKFHAMPIFEAIWIKILYVFRPSWNNVSQNCFTYHVMYIILVHIIVER